MRNTIARRRPSGEVKAAPTIAQRERPEEIMTLKTLGLLAGVALAPLGAQAATVGTFDVIASASERNQGVQSLWFETILADSLDVVYTLSSPGRFIVDALGATMTGLSPTG
jgi:hypothetical protein